MGKKPDIDRIMYRLETDPEFVAKVIALAEGNGNGDQTQEEEEESSGEQARRDRDLARYARDYPAFRSRT